MLNWRDPFSPRAGGAERASLGYMAALVERGHEVDWFSYDFPGAGREDKIKGIRIVRGGGKGTAILHARRWYRAEKPYDLVIDQHHGLPWFAPWWVGTHCIAYIHEVLGPIWRSFYRFPISSIGILQERWTHYLYRRVPFWTVSDSTRRCLERNGVRHVTVIPNGIDTVPLPRLEFKPLTTPLQLAVVSRLAPNKRIDHAIHVLDLLLRRNVKAVLTIMGAGESEPELRKLVWDLQLDNRIIFTGRVTDAEKEKVLQRSHLLLHTSVREGWGLNVIEANAMGTPAVVYPVAGLVDSTIHGRTGWIVPAETPESMADSIEGILRAPDRYQRIRLNAWERSKEFQWEAVLPIACAWLENAARGDFGGGTTETE